MREYEVDGDGHCTYTPIGRCIHFSIVSGPRDGSKQIRELASCRDYISDCIIAAANAHHFPGGKTSSLWKAGQNAPVDFGHLRLLIYRDGYYGTGPKEKIESRMFDAKRIINMYEEFAGWPGRSKIRRVNHKQLGSKDMWILIGPARWMRATQLVSMVTLIFRVVSDHGGFGGLNTLDEVEARFKELIDNNRKNGGSKWGDLGSYLPTAYPKFRSIMTKYDDLFWNKPKKFWYPLKGVGNWHGQGGIMSMCSPTSTIPHIKEVISKIKPYSAEK